MKLTTGATTMTYTKEQRQAIIIDSLVDDISNLLDLLEENNVPLKHCEEMILADKMVKYISRSKRNGSL